MRSTRIAVLLAVGLVVAGSAPLRAVASPRPSATSARSVLSALDPGSLRAAARGTGVRIGTAVDMTALAADAPYQATVAREFDTVTPENVMKWEAVEPQPGVHDWAAADQLVDFARHHGQLVRGHTLVWHNQNPSWLTESAYTPAQLRTLLRQHIFAEVGHFKGKIWAWDVANEVFNEDGTLRDTLWLRALGPDYIADAFRWAHQADPKAILFLNDYNVEGLNAKSDAYYALIKKLRGQGVPVQGFGIQGHLALQYDLPITAADNVRRFDRLGVKTAFTEVDVRMQLPADTAEVAGQSEGFGLLLRACLLAEHCISYTVWGFSDKYSWVPGVFDGQGSATPMTETFEPKPAYRTLRETFLIARR
ncbi:endo-1,4-beta-xylanase [Actinoplanes sp. SE50]|uniref:endo-1,4-beta-xylanase n=1 Tax=unclassified Actinoplanes TaxID=2626549 RepID=UPI00023EC54E|nr:MULTISPECIES: endo-1,4-beta-xylanase [unclassified Actinoplanes]AEV81392.1 endo-1,4-beta-xylanase [Actinoplanes sp. SE50/110]ATO79795.1 endo-1,4-beta-xylanase [Actinoplanes sp. SE50]SLL97197.1 endo-1,4-beta-xylanase [Actinoplanes sp. SE50/110]